MCGICGLFAPVSGSMGPGAPTAQRMADRLAHRGPDADGVWADDEVGVALGHRRLSIIDLSPLGAQPMASASGRFVLVYNGEVYNFAELRAELERAGHRFRGHSDTEVMLAAFEAWGVRAAVERFVGMFAFAVWDRRERALTLGRDRLGQKPLYVGWAGRTLVFGSELKALRAHPDFEGRVDRRALTLYLQYGYVPAPYAIFEGVGKLPPATLLRIPHDEVVRRPPVEELLGRAEAYWSAAEVAAAGQARPFEGTDAEAIEQLDAVMREAIGARMLADVPLGAFLSGGVDSSAVVALMQAQSDRPVRTFAIGSHDPRFDEAPYARDVARHLGTDHTELHVTSEDALAVIPRLATMYDEPFADSSQIPTYLVSALARRSVTVALSGDGGDELFAGYNRHAWAGRVWGAAGRVPMPLRTAVARGLTSVSPEGWDRGFGRVARVLPTALRHRWPGYKIHKLAGSLEAQSPLGLYRRLAALWPEPERVVIGGRLPASDERAAAGVAGFPSQMMLMDTIGYLPDDILTKVDRASMAVSLEARAPFMDHRLVEFAWRLPHAMKLRDGTSKWALRQVLYRYVPRELIERPKMGFGFPLTDWLRGPLRDWAEALLDERRLRDDGLLDPAPVRRAWAEHLAGTHPREYQLWTVLMLQAWLNEQHAAAATA